MNVVCYGPWRASTVRWQPTKGAWALTVACHAVFELAPGESPVVAKPIALEPVDSATDDRAFVEPWGPVAPLKRRAEVLVVGHAYAPDRSTSSLSARLRVGDLDKQIQVQGDSYFTPEGVLVGPAPFARVPLRWQRAAGAPDGSNPVGILTGRAVAPDRSGRIHLPNLLPVGETVERRDRRIPAVGLGPIRPDWPSRRERLQRHAATFDPSSWVDVALPDDFDGSYFNVAPSDQTTEEILGNERIVLEHLHPRFPRLVTYLAPGAPFVVATGAAGETGVPMRCDTVVFDTDRGLAIVVWRGCVALDHPTQDGVIFVSGAPLGASSTATLDGADAAGIAHALPFQGRAMTITSEAPPARPPLPFRPSATAEAAASETREHDEDVVEAEPPTLRHAELASTPPPPPSTPHASEPPPLAREPSPPLVVLRAEPPPTPRPPPPSVPPAPPSLPPPPPRPTVESSIEHCATVAARLAMPRADTATVLGAEALTDDAWTSHHARWLSAIDAELDRGKKKLLASYDAAYVSALEAARGPIEARDYARLAIAAERGKADGVLTELGLPGDSMMRIQRVWLSKMVADPRRAAEVRAAKRLLAEE